MIKINPESINDLIALKEAGVPVTLTSHPGNASLYKLVLWKCGIPEHLWDVTCCKADANNWPMHRLRGGEAELVIHDDLYRKILKETCSGNRFVTAYQFCADGTRLGRLHVRESEECFPGVISSCSRLLLSEREKVADMFEYLAHTKRDEVFTRFITPEGVMLPLPSDIRAEAIACSFMNVLKELEHLLFSDDPIATEGGACYGGIMAPLSVMLAQFWQTGRMDRYDISGPDMIHYATTSRYQASLSAMLQHLRKWQPELIPKSIMIQMFPGTAARVGHVCDHPSEEVIRRKAYVLECANSLEKKEKMALWEQAKHDEKHWPTQIRPSVDKYFSQHDLASSGKEIVVDDFWKDLPLRGMHESLMKAKNLLRLS